MDAEFARRDADKNGIVSRAELEQFERATAQALAHDQNRRLFAKLDTDRNGSLSAAEFAAVVGPVTFQDVSLQMKRLDKNQDQQVTPIEYRAATLAGFDRLDTNLDGVVTGEEMRAANLPVSPR